MLAAFGHRPRRAVRPLALAVAGLLCLAGCRPQGRSGITLAGSTSVQPFAERLAELYMHQHRGVEVNVQGGGSSAGIRAVNSGICQIGMSSRNLHADEERLRAIPIAHDAIVIVVHASNPVRDLTLVQARDVFSGRIRNWRELGGPDRPITVVTREEGSGTRASFEEKVMVAGVAKPDSGKPQPAAFAADALVQDSNGAVREIAASDPAAVGYISFGLVDHRVVPLTLDGVMPSESAVRSGQYPIGRRFLFLTRGEVTGEARRFIEYALSPAGQQALVDEGLIRISR
ncbi:phosphate ABC transporter substrate-binding protein [candidate division WOR-3 bacterium]|nr:phosphate ABC transporter substrate-binding protein [candidate division WOR-3 bacterium]